MTNLVLKDLIRKDRYVGDVKKEKVIVGEKLTNTIKNSKLKIKIRKRKKNKQKI